jgi:hypothetical protein
MIIWMEEKKEEEVKEEVRESYLYKKISDHNRSSGMPKKDHYRHKNGNHTKWGKHQSGSSDHPYKSPQADKTEPQNYPTYYPSPSYAYTPTQNSYPSGQHNHQNNSSYDGCAYGYHRIMGKCVKKSHFYQYTFISTLIVGLFLFLIFCAVVCIVVRIYNRIMLRIQRRRNRLLQQARESHPSQQRNIHKANCKCECFKSGPQDNYEIVNINNIECDTPQRNCNYKNEEEGETKVQYPNLNTTSNDFSNYYRSNYNHYTQIYHSNVRDNYEDPKSNYYRLK